MITCDLQIQLKWKTIFPGDELDGETCDDRLFEAYKREMEKYLSVVCDNQVSSKKKGKKKGRVKKDTPATKPVLKQVGSIKSQFEPTDAGRY